MKYRLFIGLKHVKPHYYFRIGNQIWACHFKLGPLVLASHRKEHVI